MKKEERDEAIRLRREGVSIKEITSALGVAKSSVSVWVRDVELTKTQKQKLSEKGHSVEVIEKRRTSRLKNELRKREIISDAAVQDIKVVNRRDLFILGVSLYWGEGAKTQRSIVGFSNSDPRLIKIMVRFFKEVCGVSDHKLHGHVFLHEHLDVKKAEKYWSDISGIPLAQFHKTTQAHNKASKGKKDSLPYGTVSIEVYNTKLFLKIMGWMEGIYKKTCE